VPANFSIPRVTAVPAAGVLNDMKTAVLVLLAAFLAIGVEAQENAVKYSREFFAFGGALTVGDNFAADNLGYGISANHYQFIDPSRPDGVYYGILASFMLHSAGGVQIADTKFVKLGLRRSLPISWIGIDVSIAPTAGARITGDLIRGEAYVGICPSVGVYFTVDPSVDIELSYEPVINLFSIGGDGQVRNKSYEDLTLLVCFKTFSQVKSLPWDGRTQR
jgi:hypothetical protein